MAGTDRSRDSGAVAEGDGPAIVLVGPQLGDNVGAAARAMLNCGLTDLRLVRPRDGWPNPRAWAMASGADSVLARTRTFATPAAAIADLHHVFATTARRRDMVKLTVTPSEAATEIRRRAARGERCGVLFGPERIGLTNDEVALADAVLTFPLNPAFRSLNLAQAVLLIAWEWYRAEDRAPSRVVVVPSDQRQATREELLALFDHLERELDGHGFFKVAELRPTLVRNLRNVLHRAQLTDREVRTLHGVITSLAERRKGGS